MIRLLFVLIMLAVYFGASALLFNPNFPKAYGVESELTFETYYQDYYLPQSRQAKRMDSSTIILSREQAKSNRLVQTQFQDLKRSHQERQRQSRNFVTSQVLPLQAVWAVHARVGEPFLRWVKNTGGASRGAVDFMGRLILVTAALLLAALVHKLQTVSGMGLSLVLLGKFFVLMALVWVGQYVYLFFSVFAVMAVLPYFLYCAFMAYCGFLLTLRPHSWDTVFPSAYR